ncbi:MAG: divergent PAP2 family protein [Defluviitaleaceae bacterium]|nr:divergent PAP2 family protein [Defluviitaleaceae bacterium]
MLFNIMIESAILANLLAQLVKIPIYYVKHKTWRVGLMLSTGGMPSSHGAFVSALATSVALETGVSSVHFAIAFVLAAVVIYDATGIRRHAGKHAAMLNKLIADLKELKESPNLMKRFSDPQYHKQFKELLGHEPAETFWGVVFGITVAISYRLLVI